jgi:hypothetical protein
MASNVVFLDGVHRNVYTCDGCPGKIYIVHPHYKKAMQCQCGKSIQPVLEEPPVETKEDKHDIVTELVLERLDLLTDYRKTYETNGYIFEYQNVELQKNEIVLVNNVSSREELGSIFGPDYLSDGVIPMSHMMRVVKFLQEKLHGEGEQEGLIDILEMFSLMPQDECYLRYGRSN